MRSLYLGESKIITPSHMDLLKVKMIEINHTLLSADTLENLIIDIITRQTTDYGEHEIDIQIKKNQLKLKLLSGEAVIVFNSKEENCDIIRSEDFKAFQKTLNTNFNED